MQHEEKGYAPVVSEWINNEGYTPRNLIAVVTRNVSEDQEHGQAFAGAIKAMLELHPSEICGFWTGFDADSLNLPGPAFRILEKYGRPIDSVLMKWRIDYDCHRHYASVGDGKEVPTVEQCTVDVMFIEPDPTSTVVVKAWHGIKMFPEQYTGIHSYRDLRRAPALSHFHGFRLRHKPRSVFCDFTLGYEAIQIGDEIHRQAQEIMNGIVLMSANPYDRVPLIDKIAKDVLKE